MAPGLLEHAAITHRARVVRGRANDRPIAVSAEMHAISQRDLEGGDARFGHLDMSPDLVLWTPSVGWGGPASSVFGQVRLAAGGANIPDR